jgi:hypothetical protein
MMKVITYKNIAIINFVLDTPDIEKVIVVQVLEKPTPTKIFYLKAVLILTTLTSINH